MNQNLIKNKTLFTIVDQINHRTLLILILLIGLALRIYAAVVGQGYHHTAMGDEVSAYQFILAYLAGEPYAQYLAQPVFAGTQIPGPLWTLFWLSLYKLGGDLVSNAVVLMAVFNSISIYLTYRLGSYFLDKKHALFVTALYALSPWPIYYAAGMWNPMPLPVIGGLLILALWKSCAFNRSKAVFFVPLLSAILFQFHTIVIFYFPIVLLLILLAGKRINWRYFSFGVIAGAMLYMPYLIGEMNNDWNNTRDLFTSEPKASYGFIKSLTSPPALISSTPGKLAGKSEELKIYGNLFVLNYQILFALLIPSIIISLIIYFGFMRNYIVAVIKLIRKKESKVKSEIIFIGTIIFIPTFLFMLTGHNYATRYALIVLPLLFVLPGIFLSNLSRHKEKFKLYFLFIFLLNIYITLSFYSYQGESIIHGSTFKPSFKKMEEISRLIDNTKLKSSHIEFALSSKIESLPSVDLGKYKAMIEFVHLEQKYIYVEQKYDSLKTRFIISSASENIDPENTVIYTDGSIIIQKES